MRKRKLIPRDPVIATERLEIKPLRAADAAEMFEYRGDSEAMRFQHFSPRSVDDVARFIEGASGYFDVENRWFQLGVFLDGRLIGDIGVHFVGPDNSACEIGYTIGPKFQNRGFGRESVSAVLDFLFRDLGKSRVTAAVDAGNAPSIALLRSLEFARENDEEGELHFRLESARAQVKAAKNFGKKLRNPRK